MQTLIAFVTFVLVFAGPAGACELTLDFFATSSTSALIDCMDADFIDERTTDLSTVLHLTVRADADPVVIDAIHDAVGDGWASFVERVDNHNMTALHIAAGDSTDPRILSRLLAYGANPDALIDAQTGYFGAYTERGTTALHLAAVRPDGAPFVTALLAGGADPGWERSTDHRRPIYLAAKDAESVDVLAAFAAFSGFDDDLDNTDSMESTALMAAASNDRSIEVVRFLLTLGADPDAADANGLTALHWAASYSTRPEVVTLLFDRIDDACAVDEMNRTAQMMLTLPTSPLKDSVALIRRFHETCIETPQ